MSTIIRDNWALHETHLRLPHRQVKISSYNALHEWPDAIAKRLGPELWHR